MQHSLHVLKKMPYLLHLLNHLPILCFIFCSRSGTELWDWLQLRHTLQTGSTAIVLPCPLQGCNPLPFDSCFALSPRKNKFYLVKHFRSAW